MANEHLKMRSLINAWELTIPMRMLGGVSLDTIKTVTAVDILSRNTVTVQELSGALTQQIPLQNIYRSDSGALIQKELVKKLEIVAPLFPEQVASEVTGAASTIDCDMTGAKKASTTAWSIDIDTRFETDGFYLDSADFSDDEQFATYAETFAGHLRKALKAMDEKLGALILDAVYAFRKVNTFEADDKIFPQGGLSYIDPSDFEAGTIVANLIKVLNATGMEDAVLYDGNCTTTERILAQFKENEQGSESQAQLWRGLPIVQDYGQMLKHTTDMMYAVRPNSVHVATSNDYLGKTERFDNDFILTTVLSPSFGAFGISYDMVIRRKCESPSGKIGFQDHCRLVCNCSVFNVPTHPSDQTPDIFVFKKAAITKPTATAVVIIGQGNQYSNDNPVIADGSIQVPADAFTALDKDDNALTVSTGTLTLRQNTYVGKQVQSSIDLAAWGAAINFTSLESGTYALRWEGTVTQSGQEVPFIHYLGDIYVP